jgi:hypothetical protein
MPTNGSWLRIITSGSSIRKVKYVTSITPSNDELLVFLDYTLAGLHRSRSSNFISACQPEQHYRLFLKGARGLNGCDYILKPNNTQWWFQHGTKIIMIGLIVLTVSSGLSNKWKWCMLYLVLATVPGYPAAVWVWNRTRWSSPGWNPENRGTRRVRGRVGTALWFHLTVPTPLAPIKYLNSNSIAIWSIREMWWLMPCFCSHSQICDRISIHWVTLKLSGKTCQNDRVSIATPRKLVQLQIWEREMKEGIKLHISCIYYVAMRWELQYLLAGRSVDFSGACFVWKPVATDRFQVRPGSATELGVWTRC